MFFARQAEFNRLAFFAGCFSPRYRNPTTAVDLYSMQTASRSSTIRSGIDRPSPLARRLTWRSISRESTASRSARTCSRRSGMFARRCSTGWVEVISTALSQFPGRDDGFCVISRRPSFPRVGLSAVPNLPGMFAEEPLQLLDEFRPGDDTSVVGPAEGHDQEVRGRPFPGTVHRHYSGSGVASQTSRNLIVSAGDGCTFMRNRRIPSGWNCSTR
jgi:hypothetical protein